MDRSESSSPPTSASGSRTARVQRARRPPNGRVVTAVTHLTFPPQYWHCGPCQPSWQTHVPFTQTPLPHSTSLHPSSAEADTSTRSSISSSTCSRRPRTAVDLVRFRRYLDLNRNRNWSTTAFMTSGQRPRRRDRREPRTMDLSLLLFAFFFVFQLQW